jgi:DNA-directed RNA polymerase specialized sigma24 family protein
MDRRSAEEIVRQYLDKFYGFALKRTANTQDAEDLAQEISLNCFSCSAKYRAGKHPCFFMANRS